MYLGVKTLSLKNSVPRYKDINTRSAVIVFFPVQVVQTQISLSVRGDQNLSRELTQGRNIVSCREQAAGIRLAPICDRLLSAKQGKGGFIGSSCYSVKTVTPPCH